MSHKEKSEKIKKRKIFTGKNVVFGIFVFLFLIMYFQIQSVFGTFDFLQGRDSSLISEIGQIKESYTKLGGDLNEVREFLRMPTTSYGGFDENIETGEDNQDKNTNSVQLALFKYVDFLAESENLEKNLEKQRGFLSGLAESETFGKFLSDQELKMSELLEDDNAYSLRIDAASGENLVLFYLGKGDGKLFQKTIQSKEELAQETAQEFEQALTKFLTEEKADLIKGVQNLNAKQTQIKDAINSEGTQATLAELGIDLTTDFVDQDLKITYSIYNKVGDLIGQIVLDQKTLELELKDLNDDSLSLTVTDISSGLGPFLKKLETKTFTEKKASEARIDLENTVKDEGFKLLLSENGLTISQEPREDDERIYYDLYAGDTHVSSIVVEKMTGVINIVQPNGTNPENLLFFDPEFKKKTLEIPSNIPDYGDELLSEDGTFNILIAGKHGNLVDTMIFAHIDDERGDVRMVSVPRDLYYNGRKINSFPYYYGMPELQTVLSEMTGYKLDKYILIDMYAFIDVIDLIGGIDIHLDSAVIDPYYRTVDNGVVGTLHYEPGDYHLGGVEALRLARSRKTSSDFARAERQQKILEAIQDKAKNFGFGDADTIYEIAKTVLSKTETDISLDEAIAYYFRYQNYEIVSNDVMSSGNVLYVPPYITTENCDKLIAAAAAAGEPTPGCTNENHAYTLLPKNDNWNIVKWFFRQKFEDA